LPLGFDFGGVTVPGYVVDTTKTSGSELYVTGGGTDAFLVGGQPFTMKLENVKLGRGGGTTQWSIVTYSDVQFTNRSDDRQNISSFLLPGRVEVLTQNLYSQFRSQGSAEPVRSLLPPRSGEAAVVHLEVTFSLAVPAGHRISFKSEGEQGGAVIDGASLVIQDRFQAVVATTTIVLEATNELSAVVLPNAEAGTVALEANLPYLMILSLVPPSTATTWTIETTPAAQESVTNTNDGETPAELPVETLGLALDATTEAPPGARRVVPLTITTSTAGLSSLVVIAPPGFEFPTNCGINCTVATSVGSGGRLSVRLGLSLPPGTSVQYELIVRTPTAMVTLVATDPTAPVVFDRVWFIQGFDADQRPMGWGDAEGFVISSMPDCQVTYAGLPAAVGIVIGIQFTLRFGGGKSLVISPPDGVGLLCSYETLTLCPAGDQRQECVDGVECSQNPFTLTMPWQLAAGHYSLAVSSNMPPESPRANYFNIVVADEAGETVDARFQIPGAPILGTDIPLDVASQPTLSWSSSDAGTSSIIRMGVDFQSPVDNVKALFFQFPKERGGPQVVSDIEVTTDVRALNRDFPLTMTQWFDDSVPTALKIFVDDPLARTELPAGLYEFTFRTTQPAQEPAANLWFLTLCRTATCALPTEEEGVAHHRPPEGDEVHVSFALPGFQLGTDASSVSRLAGASEVTTIAPGASTMSPSQFMNTKAGGFAGGFVLFLLLSLTEF